MATRYYVKGDTIYISPGPAEHKPVQSLGFVAFSPYDAVKYGTYTPDGFTRAHMLAISEQGRRGFFGTFQRVNTMRIERTFQRVVKLGRGKGWALQVPEQAAE